MRIGILSPTQAPSTPYSQATRFVSKKAVKALLVSLCRAVEGRKDVIQERPQCKIVAVIKIVPAFKTVPTIVEKQYQRSTVRNRIKKQALPPADANPNFDLSYPMAMPVTVHHRHPAFQRECKAVREQAVQKKRERREREQAYIDAVLAEVAGAVYSVFKGESNGSGSIQSR